MYFTGTTFHGYRNHVAAVRRTMPDEIDSDTVTTTVASIRFYGPAQKIIEAALDRVHPEWRNDPMAHLTTFGDRPDWVYLTQIRHKICDATGTDPRAVQTTDQPISGVLTAC